MDDLISRVLEPILQRFLTNFKREQLTVSFMKGRGVMRNLVVNTRELNNLLRNAPFRVSHITIDQLSIKASLTRITTRPVTVFIDHIDVDLYEPWGTPQQEEATKPGPAKPTAAPARRSYGLADRITDGVRVEIKEVRVRLRTLGKRKCPKPGPWNPPDGLLVLRGVRLFSTDELGFEGDLEECWRYNKGRKGARDFFVFKKSTVQSVSFSLLPRRRPAAGSSPPPPIPLLVDVPVETVICLRRSLHDVSVLFGVDVEVRLDRASIRLARADGSFAFLVSFLAGLGHCVAGSSAAKPSVDPLGGDGPDAALDGSYASRLRGYSEASAGMGGGERAASMEEAERGTEGGQEDEQGGEQGEDDDEEDDEESVGSEDSGFSQGQQSSLAPDFSLTGDLSMTIADDDRQTASDDASLTSNGAASTAAAGRPTAPHARVALGLCVSRGEVRLVDDGVGGFVLSLGNLRLELIHGEDMAPSEAITQAYLTYFELRELGADESPLLRQPALIRPHDASASATGPGFDTVFPDCEPRGVRDTSDFPPSAEGLQTCDVLCVKTHTLAFPALPPPAVSAETDVNLDRLHLVADVAAWVRLGNFITRYTDQRCMTGEWGAEVEGYVIQQLPAKGIRHVTLRSAGFTLHLPPGPSPADCALSRGAYVELSVGKLTLGLSDALPRSFAAQDGFLDARLTDAAAHPPIPTPQELQAQGSASLSPFRLKLTLADVSLTAPYLSGGAGPVTLVSPLSLAFLLSVDALCPIFDPPEGTLYVPLSNLSQLSLSVAVDTLAVQLHLPAWLALADSLLAHLETLHDRLVLPEAALPSPQPGGGPTPLTYLLRGAGLHAVVKVCSIRLALPGLTAVQEEVAADGPTDKAEGGQQAHIVRVEAVDTQTVLSVSPSGDLDCGSLLGGFRVCTSTGGRSVVLLELARLGTAVAPASSEQKGQGVGSGEQHYCNDAFCRSCPDKAPGPSGSGIVLARVQCQGPRPSSQRSSFLRQPGSSACHEDTGGEGAWGRGAGAGMVDEGQVSIDVKEGAAITAPLPVLQAVLDELHALLSAQADVHGLSHHHAHPDPRFPEGSIGRLLLSGGAGPSPPQAGPATPRALHGRLLLLLLRVRVSVDRMVVQIPLGDGHDTSTTVVLEASAPQVRGRLLLQPRGAPPPDQEDDEAFSMRWEATGTVGYWLAGAGQGGGEQQAAGRRTVVQDLQLQLSAIPAAGRAGGWLVDCVPPPEQVRMHTGLDWSEARAALRAGLDRLKQHPLLGGRGSRKRALPTQMQVLVPSAEQRQAAEGAEDVRLLEAMEASAWSSQVAWAAQAGEQVSALRLGMRRAAAGAEREREQLREKVAVLRAALRAKEVQRQHLLAMHHADHVGFLRVGPQQSKPAQQLKRKGGSSKALLSLPRYWCVLRQGLLLCYDQPHSLRLVEHFPLYRCALADYVPQDAKTHYRRAYALVYRAKAAGPRPFLFVAESEEDLQAWKAALEPHLLTATSGSTPASPSSKAGPGLSARSTPPPPQSPPRSAPSTPPNRPSARRGLTGRTPTPGERAGSTSSMSIKTGASAAGGGGGGVKSLRHSFSFSPGRLLKGSSGGGDRGRKTPTARWHRSMSDAATEPAVPDGATGTPLLVAEAERVRRLDVRATAVTPAVKEAAAREPLSSPCFIITSARADPALKPRRSSTTPLQRLVSAAMSDSAPAAPSSSDGGRKGGQADLEGCVARSFADLLAFHGGYVERWSCVMEEAQGTASSPRAGGSTPSLSALLQPFASGTSEAEALSYANQLLVGSQKLLQAYVSDEHTRRQQVELVDRYLKLLASYCPADRQCLDLLTDLLGLSAALPGTPPRVLSPSREAASATHRARSLSPPLPPHHHSRSPDRRSITPPLPPPLAIEPGISSASSSLRSCASRGEQAAPATDDLASQQRSLRSCEAGVGSQSPPSLRRWARPGSPRASGLTRPKAVPAPGGFLTCDTQVLLAAVGIDPWEDDDHNGSSDRGTQRHSSAEELEGAMQALGRLGAALRGQRTAMLLQGTLLDEYRSAWRGRREAMAKELQARAAQWRECRGRAAWLEDRLKRAELAKEDALFAMTEVTSYSAQKLMEAEARYMNLLKAAHTADKHGRSAHRGHGSAGKQHRRATSSSAPTVTQQQQRAAGLERQGSGRHQHQHVSLSPVSSNGTIAAQAAGGQLPRRPSESSAWSSLDENSPVTPPGSSSDALDRLARALERKSQEACRANEAMLMAMEEAHGLRDTLQQTRRLAALDRAAGAGPSSKDGGGQQDKEEDVEEDGSLEGRIRALELAFRKERRRADRLQAELTATQERWRSFSCKAAQILALPSREEEGEQGKRMEQDGDTPHGSAALLTQLSQVRNIVS